MNIYSWILLVLFCAFAILVIWAGVSRCPKCHGFCEDEEACSAKRELDQQRETERQNHGQEKDSHPAA